jgi:hypothetical protein
VFGRKRNVRRISRAYQAMMETPEGKTVIRDLLNVCMLYKPTEVVGDTNATSHNNGRRHIGLHIHTMCKMTEERLAQCFGEEE